MTETKASSIGAGATTRRRTGVPTAGTAAAAAPASDGGRTAETISEAALKAADLALGAADYALEAARKVTSQLTGRGGQRRQEVTRRLNQLAERGRRLRLATRVDIEELGTRLATRVDIERLEARIAALEKAARKES